MAELKDDSPDEVMCSCSGTTRGLIQDLVKQGKDLDAISRYSGALSGCGGCEWDIGELVKELMENLPAAADQANPDQAKPE
ncbi:MAG: (2Fe-2S)-binding protein [Methylophilus sp.]|uniref:(2Fe-2S)-binding protein n=1 Tax=Methylophilus sp. TaxID=29541 RepID=UPI002B51911F|nr:(2Fe-2S)-binding protein [Methylophilus sp.]HSH87498.1 (2Fe-2S)-binding protein [Methylophilus sp.]